MKHIHIDEFAKMKSPVHDMDPRAKALAVLAFIFIAVNLTKPVLLVMAAGLWIIVLAAARIPLRHVFKRVTWILPFAGVLIILFPFITPGEVIWSGRAGIFNLTATSQGLEKAVMLMLRVLTSVLAIITLMSTTGFNNLMKAFSDLKIPAVILQMVEFTVRYIFVTIDELKRMRRARKSRGFVLGKNLWHLHTITTLAQMVGVMFLRSYERGDRVYTAMLSRNFTGKIRTMTDFRIRVYDYLKAGAVITAAVILLLLDKGGLIS